MLNGKCLFISASLSAGFASNVKDHLHLQLQPVSKNLPPNDPIDTAIFRPIQSWQLRASLAICCASSLVGTSISFRA